MGLTLAQALRLAPSRLPAEPARCEVAFVGAGGKTTALFQLARQLPSPVVVSTTTHLGAWQIPLADRHIIASHLDDLPPAPADGVTVVTGPVVAADAVNASNRFGPVPDQVLLRLHDSDSWRKASLLIEADGAHRKPLKAPVAYEPVIPPYMGMIAVVAGLSGLGKPLSAETVH